MLAILKAAGLTVPGRSMIGLVRFLKIHEAMYREQCLRVIPASTIFYHFARNGW